MHEKLQKTCYGIIERHGFVRLQSVVRHVLRLGGDIVQSVKRAETTLLIAALYPITIGLYIIYNLVQQYIFEPSDPVTEVASSLVDHARHEAGSSDDVPTATVAFHPSDLMPVARDSAVAFATSAESMMWRDQRHAAISTIFLTKRPLVERISISIPALLKDKPIKALVLYQYGFDQAQPVLAVPAIPVSLPDVQNDPEQDVIARVRPQPRPGDVLSLEYPADSVTGGAIFRNGPSPSARPKPRPAHLSQSDDTLLTLLDEPDQGLGQQPQLKPRVRPDHIANMASVKLASIAPTEAPKMQDLAKEPTDPATTPSLLSRLTGNTCNGRLARSIPRRPGNAPGGSVVMTHATHASDATVVKQILSGNLPATSRTLFPVHLPGTVDGRQVDLVVCVTGNYMAVGSDKDNVFTPLGLPEALSIAHAFDMMLPTTRMVDAIYAQADVRLAPRPMAPGPQMTSIAYITQHDAILKAQLKDNGGYAGKLVAGHKKDLVLTNSLARARHSVAIYGWHKGVNRPIQPLSTVHGATYADYSHGIRLVSSTAFINGRPIELRKLLTDKRYAKFLNTSGPMEPAIVNLASR